MNAIWDYHRDLLSPIFRRGISVATISTPSRLEWRQKCTPKYHILDREDSAVNDLNRLLSDNDSKCHRPAYPVPTPEYLIELSSSQTNATDVALRALLSHNDRLMYH
jgi:hypothetical protein